MVNNSISCFGWILRLKIRRKSKNQRKSKSLILLIISLLSRLCIWFLLSLLFLIFCGICTKQEIELLPCDLTPCHLRQFFIDLYWKNWKVRTLYLFLSFLLFLIHCGICTKQEMELLTCDLTPCHLCQFFIDLRWGRM